MKFITLAAALLFSVSSHAGVIPFVSGLDDRCVGCTATAANPGNWISESSFNAAAGSTGAIWVNSTNGDDSEYRIFELDLNRIGEPVTITSLWLSADDDVTIRVGGQEIWNSYAIRPHRTVWQSAINIIDLVGEFDIAGNNRLNFYVDNNGNGPTGIIFAGTATTVPGPGALALLGFGMLLLAGRRKLRA